eukprot:m.441990 g.441990  ORF g.441990 m.441990 type:complete len:71 (+) comp21471_c0_seq7:1682-1894(+)
MVRHVLYLSCRNTAYFNFFIGFLLYVDTLKACLCVADMTLAPWESFSASREMLPRREHTQILLPRGVTQC